MRVALCSPYAESRVSGVSVFLLELERALNARNHETVLITPSRFGGVERLPSGLRNVGLAFLTARLLVRDPHGWDAVHANQPHLQSLAALLAARIRGSRFVVTYHLGLPTPRNVAAKVLQKLVDRMIRSAPVAVVYVSKATAREFGAANGVVIYIGMDPALVAAVGDSTAKGLGPLTFAYVGRQTRIKGFFDLLDAIQDLSSSHSRDDFRLVLAGEAPAEEERERSLRLQNLEGVVEDCGNVTDRLTRLRILARADALVLPSYREGLPLVILEAMSVGCVPIATRVGGIPEIVDSGRTGILLSPGDSVALRDALRFALANRNILAEMSRKSRRTVAGRFNLDRTVEQYIELYRRT